jgi:hypothetical protein
VFSGAGIGSNCGVELGLRGTERSGSEVGERGQQSALDEAHVAVCSVQAIGVCRVGRNKLRDVGSSFERHPGGSNGVTQWEWVRS